MERLNNKTLSFPAKMFTRVFAALGVVMALAACGNKGGGGGGVVAPVVPVYGNGCVNCGAITQPVLLTTFQSEATDFSGSSVVSLQNMQVYVQGSNLTTSASGNNYNWYSGPITVQGQLHVKKQLNDYDPSNPNVQLSSCVIPVGVYTVQTSQVGQMTNPNRNGTDITFPSVVATNASIELKIEAPSPMGFTNSGSRMWAKVSVVRVNGVQCSSQFYGEFF